MNALNSMYVRRGGILLGLLVALVLAGCAEVPLVAKRSRVDDFDAAVKTYGKLMRWGYFDEAAKVLRARDGSTIEADLARVARYRVTRYDVGSKLVADTGREGRVLASIEYYDVDTGVVQELRDEQYWWYDDSEQRWFLD
ncbi:MAG: hypothetical protein RLW42_20825, partial [Gammaproteobacteria bacterium]